MITNPDQMSEFEKLRARIKRLYGMGKLTMDQHMTALDLLDAVVECLTDNHFDLATKTLEEEEFVATPLETLKHDY